MNEHQFWELIEAGKRAHGDSGEFLDLVAGSVKGFGADGAKQFDEHIAQCMKRAYSWRLWGAAYIMCGGCSDDGFEYWRQWLIGQGRAIWSAAIADPESLADAELRFGEDDGWQLEGLSYIAPEVYAELTKTQLDSVVTTGGDPAGTRWKEEDLDALFPELAAAFTDDDEDDDLDDDDEDDDDADDDGDDDREIDDED
jgi:hypothetical protein